MTAQAISVETTVAAPIAKVWDAYDTPEDIMQWNSPSDDWHTPSATVDLREGGVRVSVTFDPETENSIEQQSAGWQAILDSFKRHVEA